MHDLPIAFYRDPVQRNFQPFEQGSDVQSLGYRMGLSVNAYSKQDGLAGTAGLGKGGKGGLAGADTVNRLAALHFYSGLEVINHSLIIHIRIESESHCIVPEA